MILGMSAETYTLIHVALSLVGIGSGLIVVFGMMAGKRFNALTALFLATTAATSLTGFGFPVHQFMPSHGVGIVSLLALAAAVPARYFYHLAGGWRRTYVIGAVVALYLNVFVLIVQSFRRVPALKALDPTQSGPPFLIAQLVIMALFVWLGIKAAKGFRT
ncbi:MAG TPA: hypothetical protein VN176_10265 [Verrucomicrobiae bacterium]|jgi:hypothetical protein|nr:hypothetical protein [Verrucomicrobiae bacterium]